jgi:7-keto-8-aminopelargonate synthetase-like enzyme
VACGFWFRHGRARALQLNLGVINTSDVGHRVSNTLPWLARTHHQLLESFDVAAATISPSPQRHDHCKLPESLFRSLLSTHTSSPPPLVFHSGGCGGSHLLVHNHTHAVLEACLACTFRPSAAFLFKVRFQQHGFLRVHATVKDALPHEKAINTSVYDSLRTPRITLHKRLPFAHNDVYAFHATLPCSVTKLLLSKRARAL